MSVPSSRRLGALLFDFDHTLTDFGRWVDWRAARTAVLALYQREGLDAATLASGRGAFSVFGSLDEALALQVSRAHADEVQVEAFRILETYECAGAERARLLPGTAEALAYAAGAGLDLGIVSANAESAIRIALDRLGVVGRFGTVIGRTRERPPKPAPDMHLEALRRLDCLAESGLAIGDSPNDMRAAAAAGVLTVGVVGGLEGNADDLFAAGACWVLADLRALPTLLALWAKAGET